MNLNFIDLLYSKQKIFNNLLILTYITFLSDLKFTIAVIKLNC